VTAGTGTATFGRTADPWGDADRFLRQSILARMDECPLSAKFEMEGARFNTHPQAAGILFHRTMAMILHTLLEQGEEEIPTQEAIEILYEVARQRDLLPEDRVRCSMRDLALVRLGVVKCVTDNRFSVNRLVSIEDRLFAKVTYLDDDGHEVERVVSAQPDALLADVNDTAVVLDWKLTWALPPERKERTDQDQQFGHHVSYEGYFQQRFHGLVVMRTYPTIQRVRLREYYPLRGKVRSATVKREDLEHIEREISLLCYEFDRLRREGGPWLPSPGKHCGFCRAPAKCPIEADARGEGAISSARMAERYAAEREVADVVRTDRTEALKVWVSNHGPVKVKASKERREIGWRIGSSGGKNFGAYVPDEGDVKLERDPLLEAQMKASIREQREMRKRAATG
jgi:PD-(D/E)XK nuclease superfamily